MRLITLAVIALIFLSVEFLIAQGNNIDFSGEWILDKDKSQQGDGQGGRRRGRVPTKLIVTQEVNELEVTSFRTNRDGEEVTVDAKYTLDGEECENKMFNRTSISTAEWSEDGNSLLILTEITFIRGDQEFTMDAESSWSLEKENLVIESSISTPRGDRSTKAVFRKE